MNRRRPLAIALLLCGSLAVKLAGVAYMNRNLAWNLLAPDARDVYRPIAISLVEGGGYQLDGDRLRATKVAPGFPVYLAAVYRVFGIDAPIWWLGVLNALMRTGTTLLVYLLAARAFGSATGFAAGALHALDPWEAFWSAIVLKESLAVLLSVLAIYALVRAFDARSWQAGAAAGIALGAASLTRFATLGLFPWTLFLIALAAARRIVDRRAASRLAMAVTLGLIAGLSPWIVRNYPLFGGPMVFTRVGYYFFLSNGPGTERSPDTSGYSGYSPADQNRGRQMVPPGSGYTRRQVSLLGGTMAHLAAHPRIAVTLIAARAVNMWRPTFAGSSIGNIVVLGASYSMLMVAALVGLMLGLGRRDERQRSARFVLYGTVAFYIVLHAAFWSEVRYRQYAMPLLTAFAGHALVRSWTAARHTAAQVPALARVDAGA
jgi:4-amino-4-deoxy-L-arabinose transferase-like glycosyltransferase